MKTPEETELARDPDERVALLSLLEQQALRLPSDELRAVCVAVNVLSAYDAQRIPSRILVAIVIGRAWAAGKLQALYEAVDARLQ